ncbi:MAG: STAS-like domain-containing protein [Candidatus Aenigmarchaeota archaeon]|nr:STAS-like domain-containing protein [Candidatus Aenigmarchaeota archaeon]
MIRIKLFPLVGSFAENKDIARQVRIGRIIPALEGGKDVTIDFEKVEAATQSFIHALISDIIRKYGSEILDRIYFKNCSETVKKMITIVVDYMQESV